MGGLSECPTNLQAALPKVLRRIVDFSRIHVASPTFHQTCVTCFWLSPKFRPCQPPCQNGGSAHVLDVTDQCECFVLFCIEFHVLSECI